MKYIARNIENKLIESLSSFPVVMLTGARQTGKTTTFMHIARSLPANIDYVSFDDIEARSLAAQDPELFLAGRRTPLIIDEFQYAPQILPYIKMRVDKARNEALFDGGENPNGMYLLTGSQSFVSMKNVTESLAGRVAILSMSGLSGRELDAARGTKFVPASDEYIGMENLRQKEAPEIFDRIFRGGYPEMWAHDEISRDIFFGSYVNTYIERDIRTLSGIKDELKFSRFLVAAAARSAQELNVSDLASETEVSSHTIDEWLSLLVNTGIVFLLQPYYRNIEKRVIKRPKLYFMDTGLACYLTRYPSPETLMNSAYAGAAFETYVVSEIVKTYLNAGLDPNHYLYYYRDSNKVEIDMIVDIDGLLYPIEIKKSASPSRDAAKSFSVLKKAGLPVANGTVICMRNETSFLDRDTILLPATMI